MIFQGRLFSDEMPSPSPLSTMSQTFTRRPRKHGKAVSRGTVKGVTEETFIHDSELWRKRLLYYRTINNQLSQPGRYRNFLDMNAFLGGFAAALVDDPVWVMNVVPVDVKVNTLGVIYDRGLIGTYQDW